MAGGAKPAAENGRSRINLWPLGLIAVILGFALFGDRGILHLVKLTNQKEGIVAELAQVEAQNEALRQEITLLRNDRTYIERLARTELGMVRDDELVFQFAGSSGGSSSEAAFGR